MNANANLQGWRKQYVVDEDELRKGESFFAKKGINFYNLLKMLNLCYPANGSQHIFIPSLLS